MTYLNFADKGFVVEAFVFPFDGAEVDLGAGDQDADERGVVSAEALHGAPEPRREPCGGVLHAFNCKRSAATLTLTIVYFLY